ncbi:hypothetical protein DL763_002096 [Monosporascus cannonballus]|nr:hypothetical protein DL763_002096 [Monosporascus cannonballus]
MEVFLNGRKDRKTYGLLGYVCSKVRSKQASDHIVENKFFTYPITRGYVAHCQAEEKCKEYLKKLLEGGGRCYGPSNGDTKGGTWRVGDNAVSYHALGSKVPPREDALNKLYADAAISEQHVNRCDVPLFSALAAGCLAVQADVHLVGDDLEIGRNRPARGRTLGRRCVGPLPVILGHNGGGWSGGRAGDFGAKPDHGPHADGGLQDYGSAPIDRIASGDGIPSADVFYDADVNGLDGRDYRDTNSYYASVNNKGLSRKPSFGGDDEEAGCRSSGGAILRQSESEWEKPIELGVDMLDADDMSNTARLPRIRQTKGIEGKLGSIDKGGYAVRDQLEAVRQDGIDKTGSEYAAYSSTTGA